MDISRFAHNPSDIYIPIKLKAGAKTLYTHIWDSCGCVTDHLSTSTPRRAKR